MSPDRDDRVPDDDEYTEEYAEDEPRSVFATTWFRAIVVVVVLAVVGIIALPYVLDWVSPLRSGPTVTGPTLTSPSPPRETAAPPSSPAPSTPSAGGGPATQTAQAPQSAGEPAKTSAPPAGTSAVPASKTAEPSTTDAGKSPAGQAPSATESKTATSGGKTGKAVEAAKPAVGSPPAKAAAPKAAGRREAAAHAGGAFWVQVGAFRDVAHAKALAAKLRADNFKVEEIGPAPSGGRTAPSGGTEGSTTLSQTDRYDVFVSGASSADVNAKLAGKGLAADPVAGGAVVKPSLPLRDAVALSKDLATEGLKVQVRRAAAAAAARRPATTGDGLYRIRVGSFSDRAAAEETRKALAAKGYSGFVARGGG